MKENKKSVSTKRASSHCKTSKEKQEDFIMLPTVDFCFKELMQNDNIRKNIIAALLNVPSSEVENTELMPTILRKESKDDKYGILDVRVRLKDGEQIDFEMQVEAFDCWANRSVYYLSKMYAGEIKEGEGYDCLKKCIHVSILAYDHFQDDKECYRRKRRMRQACCSGCAFLEEKPERILKKWQRKILNWKKHMTYWIN